LRIPIRNKPAAGDKADGRIDIKTGKPANTCRAASFVGFGCFGVLGNHPAEKKMTIKCGLFVRLEAKPGKEQAVADFLAAGVEMTNREAGTPIWFALKLSPTTFGAFDAFASEEDRQAHLAGNMAKALMSRVDEMLAKPPSVEPVDILGMKNQLA
jgi:quinol monooxygenase YgiN